MMMMMIDDDDGWRDSKCRSHPLINGCDKKHKEAESFCLKNAENFNTPTTAEMR